MNYRLTCLTPVLVGDGTRLSPVDYMVWKDQVNVLDQRRIFRLLAKGPRLDSYLVQIRRAEKLDFASWGGFAQNFAGRRIPFEHASMTAYWERLHAEHLHIPTFVSGPRGPYVPGAALKGALRSALLFSLGAGDAWTRVAAQMKSDRPSRRAAEPLERQALGAGGHDRFKSIAVCDSGPVSHSGFKIYMVRTATLEPAGSGQLRLGWKQSPRGSVDSRRIEESTPAFVEMAPPGTAFEGTWIDRAFYRQEEFAKAMHWPAESLAPKILAAANDYAARLLDIHEQYARWGGLSPLGATIGGLRAKLEEARAGGRSCLVCLGWGGSMFSKSPWLARSAEGSAEVLRQVPLYSRSIREGVPFPKTRRIVFTGNQPAALAGWSILELS